MKIKRLSDNKDLIGILRKNNWILGWTGWERQDADEDIPHFFYPAYRAHPVIFLFFDLQ